MERVSILILKKYKNTQNPRSMSHKKPKKEKARKVEKSPFNPTCNEAKKK